MTSFALDPVFGSVWSTMLITLMCAIALLVVRPAGNRMHPGRIRLLILLRIGALLLLFIAMLRPAIVRTDNRPTASSLAVLADASRSMTLPDGDGQSRWETQAKVLQELAPTLADMDDALEIKFYQYGQTTVELPLDQLDAFVASVPEQRQTDLAEPLRIALAGSAGRPISGVVMLGDGTSTVPDSNPGVIARNLAALEVPLWTIPIGPPAGDSQTRDVAIQQLPETFRVFSKNLFRVTAAVETRGMYGRDVPVSVLLVEDDGTERELAKRILVPESPSETLPLDIELQAPGPGSYRLVVRAESQEGETVTDNNRQIAFLDVREGGGKIIYFEGQPRLEQLFLRRSLDESADLVMTLQLAPRSESRWPINVGKAFQPGQYDVIVLGDISAAALGKENLEDLVVAIESGAGLLMLGGQKAFDLGGYANSPLARILPVQMQPTNLRANARNLTADRAVTTPIQLRIKKPHPITRLGSGADSNSVWNDLKPLVGANKFAGLKPDPTTEVLLESTEGQPILVVGGYGSGRIAMFAGDTTWQWWRQGKGDIHRRFWRQLVLWLLSREGPEMDSIWVRMDSRRFEREKPASFVAGIQMAGDSANAVNLQAEVIMPDGETKAVSLISEIGSNNNAGDQPLVGGKLPDLPGGIYQLRVFDRDQAANNITASGQSAGFEDAKILFQVVDMDVELSRPLADVARLQQLSAITADAGGKSFRPDEVDSLVETIRKLRTRSSLPVIERHRLGEGPISAWLLMIAFSSLLGSEWYLRKHWGLA